MYKSIDSIRQQFINFFVKKNHQIVASSSLIPENDQTLLFTNSGMNQFKNIFLGIERSLSKRVVTVQRCMRAGGKHNDLDNVGYTGRHLTFFEMLGNFSFGDYFKSESIQFAWELLTSKDWYNLSPDRIWVTTHACDDESYNIWKKDIGILDGHLIKIGHGSKDFCDSSNFWQMGNVGPCGPCSEIFYDLENDCKKVFPNKIKKMEDRYVEIWNLVFMQFDRKENGKLSELPVLSVDTGMGLERITAILQGVRSNYLIDAFKNLIVSISQVMKISDSNADHRSLCVIADHIRACSFLIKDGVIPANVGRGYVLRRIIRRAICHGKKLGVNGNFLYKLVTPLLMNMQYITNILFDQKDFIEDILFNEEKLFETTLKKGSELLNQELVRLEDNNILSGQAAFRLYTTYGLPLDLIKDICYERNIHVDQLEFDQLMLKEKKSSKRYDRFCTYSNHISSYNIITKFVGYQYSLYESKIVAMFQNGVSVNRIDFEKDLNKESMIVLDVTPFYGESGGQIGDCGYLKTVSGTFQVIDTKKYKQFIVHIGVIESGYIALEERVFAQIDQLKRKKVCLNHSATHLLHAALLKILGSHIIQKGSLVSDKYLRFDFSYYKSITESQIFDIESFVNHQIWNNLMITSDIVSIETAKNMGAIMFFQKQYDKNVRILKIGDISIELCAGTHATYTGEIGFFMIIKKSGVGLGVKRIEAVTHDMALFSLQNKKMLIQNMIQIVQGDEKNLSEKVYALQLNCNALRREIKVLQNKQEFEETVSYMNDVCNINGVSVFIKQFENAKSQVLFTMVPRLRDCLKSGIIILVNVKKNDIIHLVISVTKDLVERDCINALNLMSVIMENFGGKGGGKSDFVQMNIHNLALKPVLIKEIRELINGMLM